METSGDAIHFDKVGYKYALREDWSFPVGIRPPSKDRVGVEGGWVALSEAGEIEFKASYFWDGPSGPTSDTQDFMRGSLAHDGLYQLLREGKLGEIGGKTWARNRKRADKLLRTLCKLDGMSWIKRSLVYRAVRWFGASSARPSNAGNPRCAPQGCTPH